jgi:hypothetical protein
MHAAKRSPACLETNSQELLMCYDVCGMSEIIALEKFLWSVVVFSKTAPVLVMLPSRACGMLVPQINLRLKLLNRQLERFWHVKSENE